MSKQTKSQSTTETEAKIFTQSCRMSELAGVVEDDATINDAGTICKFKLIHHGTRSVKVDDGYVNEPWQTTYVCQINGAERVAQVKDFLKAGALIRCEDVFLGSSKYAARYVTFGNKLPIFVRTMAADEEPVVLPAKIGKLVGNLGKDLWIHPAGTVCEFSVANAGKESVRNEDGEYVDQPTTTWFTCRVLGKNKVDAIKDLLQKGDTVQIDNASMIANTRLNKSNATMQTYNELILNSAPQRLHRKGEEAAPQVDARTAKARLAEEELSF